MYINLKNQMFGELIINNNNNNNNNFGRPSCCVHIVLGNFASIFCSYCAKILSEMDKARTAYSKERKFCGNRHVSCKKVRENEEVSATGDVGRHLQVILPMMPLLFHL